MQENENDVEYKRSELTRRLNAGENVIIQSDRAAVLQNVANPKAQYHFVVLPKEDIENVIAVCKATYMYMHRLYLKVHLRCS